MRLLALLLLAAPLAAQTKDSLVSSTVDSTPITVWQKTYTITYVRVPAIVAGPAISGVTVSSITQTGAVISWNLSQPATGQVAYGMTIAYGTLSAPENTYLYATHNQTLSGLAPGTQYHYAVTSRNQAGGSSTSPDATFTTTAAVTPPPSGGSLASITFEDGTFGGLTDGGGGKPVGATIVSGGCYGGSKCFDINLSKSSSDQGGSGYWVGPARYTDLYVSFALNVLASPTSGGVETQKMLIFRDLGSAPNQFGEWNQAYGGWIWSWLFTESGPNYPVPGLSAPTSPGWHLYKVHLHCAAPATVTFGVDGHENVASLATKGAACAHLPNTVTFGGTLNASSGASHFQFDNIKIGTSDQGWP